MITVIYDSNYSVAIPDGKISEFCDNLKDGQEYTVSNFLIIDELRARINEQKISHENIQFKSNNQTFIVDYNGRMSHWPDGFGDIYEKILTRLLF